MRISIFEIGFSLFLRKPKGRLIIMKSVGKKMLAVALSLLMTVGVIFIDLGTTRAEATSYNIGDIIEYGSYPQSKVNDTTIINQLNKLSLSWVSYGFYTGDGSYGSMTPSGFMRYADVFYLGNKYRAVIFDSYRPISTRNSTFIDTNNVTCYQKENGYEYGHVYWFKYEPIKWRVLDPTTGYIFSDLILDTQAFSNYVQKSDLKYYNDFSEYASKYSSSSIRIFLNQTFMNLAFSDKQKDRIKDTTIVTKSAEVVGHGNGTIDSYSEYNDPAYDDVNVRDKVFLMSYYDLKEPSYGFDNSIIATDINIDMRGTYGTDYAYCLGLGRGSDGKSSYWLRNSDCYIGHPQGEVPESGLTGSNVVRGCGGGSLFTASTVSGTTWGIKPAMHLTDLNLYSVSYDANGGSGAPASHSGDVSYTIKSTIPTRSGYNFLGWAESKSATIATYHAGDSITPIKNTVLYAVWSDSTNPVASISCTNNVSPSQTVTLSFSDNDGIDGYYWGTSSSYLNNTYTSTSSTSTTKSINTEGTYYLVVKDKAGNLSDSKSITLYKTTLNANGGSVSPESVLTASGKSFTLPIPIYSGKSFSGWNTSSSGNGSSYKDSYNPSSSKTLYAQWIKDTTFKKANRFSFNNSSRHFMTSWSGGGYFMTSSDTEKLFNFVKKYESYPDITISGIQDFMNSEWGGSCYGMAVVSLLDYREEIAFNENFDTNAATLYDVKSPSSSQTIMSGINYYMLSQFIPFIDDTAHYYNSNNSNWSIGLEKLVQTAKKGNPFLFSYWYSSGGHAIAVYSYRLNSDGSHTLLAYDNNYPENDVEITIDSNYNNCTIDNPRRIITPYAIEFDDDMSKFSLIDIDGPNNDMNISYGSYSHQNANTQLMVTADGDVSIKNKAGETINIKDGNITGSMNILSTHMIVSDKADGTAGPVKFLFDVADSQSFTIKSSTNAVNASISSNSMYASASANNTDGVVFGENEGVYVIGDNMEYKTALSSKDSGYDTVIVEGNSNKDVSLTYSGNNIIIGGVTSSNEKITIFTQNADSEDFSVREGYNDVQITTNNKDNIDIVGSSNNNGVYDISVINRGSSISINNFISTRTESYKTTITFTADVSNIPTGATIHWFINGNDKGTGETYTYEKATGDYTVQTKLIASDGSVIAESGVETVIINSGFFARLIAFFKNLFHRLPVIVQSIDE